MHVDCIAGDSLKNGQNARMLAKIFSDLSVRRPGKRDSERTGSVRIRGGTPVGPERNKKIKSVLTPEQ